MNWLPSFLIAAITGLLGLCCSGFLGRAYVTWFRPSSIALSNDYAVLFCALLGGGAALMIGLLIARLSRFAFLRTLACAWTAVFAICGGILWLLWTRADFAPQAAGDPWQLEVEIRLPADERTDPRSSAAKASFTLASVIQNVRCNQRDGVLGLNEARLENGRWIIPAAAPVFTSSAPCEITAQLGGRDIAKFIVPLPARPGVQDEQWSHWTPTSPDSRPSYRFRVRRTPPPPRKSAAEYARERLATPKGKLDVIPPMPASDPARFR